MTDFVIMVEKAATMFVTGPDVVKTVLGEEVSFDELGGAMTHGTKSGVAHFVAKNEYDCMDVIKNLLSYIPQNNTETPPRVETSDDPNRLDHNLLNMVPEDSLKPYDMKPIILSILDDNRFFEIHELFAQNVIVGFGRMNGRTIGIVANQPMYLAGSLILIHHTRLHVLLGSVTLLEFQSLLWLTLQVTCQAPIKNIME